MRILKRLLYLTLIVLWTSCCCGCDSRADKRSKATPVKSTEKDTTKIDSVNSAKSIKIDTTKLDSVNSAKSIETDTTKIDSVNSAKSIETDATKLDSDNSTSRAKILESIVVCVMILFIPFIAAYIKRPPRKGKTQENRKDPNIGERKSSCNRSVNDTKYTDYKSVNTCKPIDISKPVDTKDKAEYKTYNTPATTIITAQEIKKDSPNILYAGSANLAENTFYDMTESPKPGTIYMLNVKNDEASFIVYEKAYKKVLADSNFLEYACEIQRSGSTRTKITTIEEGSTRKQPNGTWGITKKTVIKFE